jgi:hypothetical protein
MVSAIINSTSPPIPAPWVLAEICPPLIERPWATLTEMLPVGPDPNLSVEITPPSSIAKLPELTVTLPPVPVLSAVAVAKMPVDFGPALASINMSPGTVTKIFPPLPGPKVSLEITPPSRIVKLADATVTLPPLPEPPPETAVIFAPLSIDS